MANEFVKEMLESNHGLFYLVHDFNCLLAHYVNHQHIEHIIENSLLEKLKESEIGSKLFSKLLLEQFGLADSFHYDFKEPRLRLALLDNNTLTKLLLYAGTAYCSNQIAQVIEKDPLKKLRENMGEDLYHFAIKRVPLLVPEKPKFQLENKELQSHAIYENILYVGQRCFELCFAGEPHAILKRLALKFANTIQWDFSIAATATEKEKVWQFLHRILIKEVGSEWSLCFS